MKKLLLVALLLVSHAGLCQNQGSVIGSILDLEMNEEPLMFANVELQNTEWQAQTNLNGNFEISGITPGNYTLAISFSGYESRMLPITIEENRTLIVQEGLSAKSVDVGALLESYTTEVSSSDARISSLDKAFKK